MTNKDAIAVIWDVDGTLVDTAELHWQSWQVLAAQNSLVFTRDDFLSTFGWRNDEIIPHVFGDRFTREEGAKLSDRKEELYREQAKKGVSLLPGVRQLMQQIADSNFRQGVGSSAPRKNIELIMEVTQIAKHIAAVVAGEDVTQGKPNPEVFLNAADQLNASPERCVVIEDATVGVKAAKAGNMKSIGVAFVGHHSQADLKNAGADLAVKSLKHVSLENILGLFSGNSQ